MSDVTDVTRPAAGPGRGTGDGIPRARGRGRLAAVHAYAVDPMGYLAQTRAELGDVFELMPGFVVLCRADWTHRVLATTNDEVAFRSAELSTRPSLMSRRIELWMSARRRAWHALAGRTLAAATPGVVTRLQETLTAGRRLDLDVCRDAGLAAVAPLALHDLAGPGGGDGLLDTVAATTYATTAVTRRGGVLAPLRRRRALQQVTDDLIGRLARTAAERRRQGRGAGDVLDLLLPPAIAADGDDGDGRGDGDAGGHDDLSDEEIAQVLAAVLANTHQVVGAALAWLVAAAAAYPSAWQRPAGVDADAWTAALVDETLRLHPPIWSVQREVVRPVTYGGHRLRPGSRVVVSPLLLHRDPSLWHADPERFDPRRWLAEDPPHERHAYLPYAAGPRFCLGARFATTVMRSAAEVLQGGVTVVPRSLPEPVLDTVVVPRLRARLRSRAPA